MTTETHPHTAGIRSSQHQRIDVIDVLRGFALLGIIVSHLTSSFSSALPRIGGKLDMLLIMAVQAFVMDKFYLIFSFLFGLSFYIQLQRADAKNVKFTGRFIWRSVILLIIGNIHMLFYTGDVLHSYAILGLALLVANKFNNQVLVLLSCLLIFGSPWLLQLPELINPKTPAEIAALKAGNRALIQEAAAIRLKGSLAQVVANNIELAKHFYFDIIDRHIVILGLFLAGVVAGRQSLFAFTPANVRRFVKILVLGIALSVIAALLIKIGISVLPQLYPVILQIGLSCIYVAIIVLLYWKTPVRQLLGVFNPVGKMGLTNYLLQSVFGLLFYYGFGLGRANSISVKVSLFAVCMFFVFQVILSAIWMSRFLYGPMEWLWRSLTYFKWQPIKK